MVLKKEKKDDSFIKHPFYKGGAQALNDFIYSNLKYPRDAAKNKIEGIVIIKYDINFDGVVLDAKIMKSLGHGCDEEAIRVVKMLKFEVPKNPRKLKVVFHKDIHIHFKMAAAPINTIPTNPPIQQGYNIVYNITQEKPKEVTKENKPAPSPTYSYSIKLN